MKAGCYLMRSLLLGMKAKLMRDLGTSKEVLKDVEDVHKKEESYLETTSSPTRSPGAVRLQINSQDAYGLGF